MCPGEGPDSLAKTRPSPKGWRPDGLVSPLEDEVRMPRLPDEGSIGQTSRGEPVIHATIPLQRNVRHTPSRGRLWFAESAEPDRLHSLSRCPGTPVGYLDSTTRIVIYETLR